MTQPEMQLMDADARQGIIFRLSICLFGIAYNGLLLYALIQGQVHKKSKNDQILCFILAVVTFVFNLLGALLFIPTLYYNVPIQNVDSLCNFSLFFSVVVAGSFIFLLLILDIERVRRSYPRY
jgi:hypothetical protein